MMQEQEFLLAEGFSEEELVLLGDDLYQVAHLIEVGEMGQEAVAALKQGFLSSRPMFAPEQQTVTAIDKNGLVSFADGTAHVVPMSNHCKAGMVKTPVNSTGPHAITYTVPSYKFNELTGYVEFPLLRISGTGTGGSGSGQINSRPYMMFGAYQKDSPWGGCDAGLVYYKERGGWVLFINTGVHWYESNPGRVITQARVYLDMSLNNGGVSVLVRDTSNWIILDQLTAPINSGFSNHPNNIELTREVALAQFARRDNGDAMQDAHWSQVYAYSLVAGLTVPTTAQYLQSSHPSRYPYSDSLTRFLIGDVKEEINYILITPIKNYSEEKISITL